MFIRRALALVLVILWLWPASLHAQSEALMEAYRWIALNHEIDQGRRMALGP